MTSQDLLKYSDIDIDTEKANRLRECYWIAENELPPPLPLFKHFMKLLLIALILLTAPIASAKVIQINIKKTLEEATRIQTIVVHSYTDSTMLYGLSGSNDTLEIDCKIRRLSEPFRRHLIDTKLILKSDLAGKWPDPGDTVLVVFNADNRITLFAINDMNKYRFWDPNSIVFANSIFLIPDQKPFSPLPNCSQTIEDKWEYLICADGCLVECSAIKEKH